MGKKGQIVGAEIRPNNDQLNFSNITGSAEAYVLIARKHPIVINSQYPIFYNKDVAIRMAKRFNAVIKKIVLIW